MSAPAPGGLLALPGDFWETTPRWSLRRRLADGSQTDVVGHVLRSDSDGVVLLPPDGPAVVVAASDVVARRVIPPRPVRPASAPEALEVLAARGWPGTRLYRLGGWLLRVGGGWTKRANSCLVAGGPGLPVEAAIELVAGVYAGWGLAPVLQLAHAVGAGSAVESAVSALGWEPVDPTLFLVADLRRSAPRTGVDGWEFEWATEPTQAWAGIVRAGEVARVPAARAVLTSAAASYVTAFEPGGSRASEVSGVSGRSGGAVAAGRLVRTDDWAGLSCLEVVPHRRRQGLGEAVTRLLLQRARSSGARFAYLQVEAANTAAVELYRRLGFTVQHTYHYRRPAS